MIRLGTAILAAVLAVSALACANWKAPHNPTPSPVTSHTPHAYDTPTPTRTG
jgi:hypothetical protein